MTFNSIKGKTVFITGSRKNCGKTAFLNYVLASGQIKKPGYLSVGLDGEGTDAIEGNAKPRIKVYENDLVLSNTASIKQTDSLFKLLNVYNYGEKEARPVLVRILREGVLEISGPGENSLLPEIFSDMRRAGAETILVDGALDRITQISAAEESFFFYVAKAEQENLLSVSDSVSLIYSMSKNQVIRENRHLFANLKEPFFRHNETLFVKGAVTVSKLEKIKKTAKTLVFEDMSKVFIDYRQWKALNASHKVYFASKISLISFIVNLYNISRRDFENSVAEKDAIKFFSYNPYES